MAYPPTPFSVTATLNVPPAASLPACQVPFGLSSQFQNKSEQELVIPGSVTYSINFGEMAGANYQYLHIEQLSDPGGVAQDVAIRINAAVTPLLLPAGGFMILAPGPGLLGTGKPTPTVDVVTTAVAKIRVRAYG